MPESNEGHYEENEALEVRLKEIHQMIMDSYEEGERLDNAVMEQFTQWQQNQEPGKFDQTTLTRLMEQSRALRETVKALYAEEAEIEKKLGYIS